MKRSPELKTLERMRDWFDEDPSHWIQRAAFRMEGQRIVSMCLFGAAEHFAPDRAAQEHVKALIGLDPAIASTYIAEWNDASDRTAGEVIQLLDRTIGREYAKVVR